MSHTNYQKTTVEIDMRELANAQKRLHTRGVKETVNTALREVNRKAALQEAAAYVLAGDLHVPSEDAWSSWRGPRG
jgi:Arc/MetJ family transcription regulator